MPKREKRKLKRRAKIRRHALQVRKLEESGIQTMIADAEDFDGLMQKYGEQAVCGYMRDIILVSETPDLVTGYCALNKHYCHNTLPVRLEDCEFYQSFIQKRQEQRKTCH